MFSLQVQMPAGVDNGEDSKLLELERNIRDLEAQEWDIQTSLRLAREERAYILNKKSLVDSVPNEILVQIFRAGQLAHKADTSLITESRFEVTITHVMRRWRDVAVGTASLWTDIDVLPFTYERAMTYLERSKACSIDVRIGSKKRLWHAAPVALVDIMGVLIRHACRWRSISILSDAMEDVQAFCRFLSDLSAPVLTSLSIYYRKPLWPEADSTSIPALREGRCMHMLTGGAPSLSEVQLDGFPLRFCWPPLGAVKRLCLDDIRIFNILDQDTLLSYEQLRQALSTSSSLNELRLNGWLHSSGSPFQLQLAPIQMPNLTVLILHFVSPSLLFQLEAPRLRCLTLYRASDDHFRFMDDAFLVGRFSALKYLIFPFADIIEPLAYLKIFKAFPSVTDVFWIGSSFSAKILLGIFANVAGTDDPVDQWSCWRYLRTITFVNFKPETNLLGAMLCRRRAIALPITKFRLGNIPTVDVTVEEFLEDIDAYAVEYDADSWLKLSGFDDAEE